MTTTLEWIIVMVSVNVLVALSGFWLGWQTGWLKGYGVAFNRAKEILGEASESLTVKPSDPPDHQPEQ